MRNLQRAIIVTLPIAILAPFVLSFLLLLLTPEVFHSLSHSSADQVAGHTPFILGSAQGILAYIIALLTFGLAGVLTVALLQRKPKRKATTERYDEDAENDDDDDYGPEGDEEGTVKWFNVKKGFGFIVRDNGEEIFVHFRAIRGRGRRVLRQGQLVRFDVVDADKGLQADNVSIIGE